MAVPSVSIFLPVRPVAWMKVPEWCKPVQTSFSGRLIEKLSRTKLFKEKYVRNGFIDRMGRIVTRVFAAIGLLFAALADLALLRSPRASFALLGLSLHMVSGKLPPILNFVAKPSNKRKSGDQLYDAVRELNSKQESEVEREIANARLVIKHAPTQFEIDEAMIRAAELGEARAIEVFINEGKVGFHRHTPHILTVAASHAQADAVRTLLKHGVAPDQSLGLGWPDPITALLLGVQFQRSRSLTKMKKHMKESALQDGLLPRYEETARQLVFGGVPFNQQQLEELSKGVEALKDTSKRSVIKWWQERQERLLENARQKREAQELQLLDVESNPVLSKEFMRRKAACLAASNINHYFFYMSQRLHGAEIYAGRPCSEIEESEFRTPGKTKRECINWVCDDGFFSKPIERMLPQFLAAHYWAQAFMGRTPDNGQMFIRRFECVRDALYKAKPEAIWRRTEEIIKACSCFPTDGIPQLISIYCYS